VHWKWSKSNRKWLLCDAFKKGNFRHVVVYVAWVLFCKWNDKVQQDIENILYQERKWLSWCAKTVLNPSLTRHQESRCQNGGTLCGNYTLYYVFQFLFEKIGCKIQWSRNSEAHTCIFDKKIILQILMIGLRKPWNTWLCLLDAILIKCFMHLIQNPPHFYFSWSSNFHFLLFLLWSALIYFISKLQMESCEEQPRL